MWFFFRNLVDASFCHLVLLQSDGIRCGVTIAVTRVSNVVTTIGVTKLELSLLWLRLSEAGLRHVLTHRHGQPAVESCTKLV